MDWSFADWSAATGQERDSRFADPMFVDVAKGDINLRPDSPAHQRQTWTRPVGADPAPEAFELLADHFSARPFLPSTRDIAKDRLQPLDLTGYGNTPFAVTDAKENEVIAGQVFASSPGQIGLRRWRPGATYLFGAPFLAPKTPGTRSVVTLGDQPTRLPFAPVKLAAPGAPQPGPKVETTYLILMGEDIGKNVAGTIGKFELESADGTVTELPLVVPRGSDDDKLQTAELAKANFQDRFYRKMPRPVQTDNLRIYPLYDETYGFSNNRPSLALNIVYLYVLAWDNPRPEVPVVALRGQRLPEGKQAKIRLIGAGVRLAEGQKPEPGLLVPMPTKPQK